jgi:uncharacterized RDD family membrane protein YckC
MDTTPARIDPEGPFAWHTGPTDVLYVASWWSRAAAYLIDAVIVAGLFVLLIVVAALPEEDILWIPAFASGILFLLLYNPLLVAYNHGQTLGKKLLGLQVINKDVQPTALGRALVRELLLKTLAGVISPFNLIDYLWAAGRQDRRTLHDLAAGTVVIVRP